MNLAEVFIRRPVLAAMTVLFLVVLGFFSYRGLGVDLFPNVDLPVVTIITTQRGASPEEMEGLVTKVIEEAVNTAAGIDELRSRTQEGVSVVTVSFQLERDTAEAIQDVRDKVAGVLARLPEGVDPPIITRFDTDAIPVATFVVSGTRSLKEITEYADKTIKPELETVGGVGQVIITGGQKRAINVWLDAAKLQAYHLSVQTVRNALLAQNVELPTGRVDRGQGEQVLRTMARIDSVEQFAEIIVAHTGGSAVTLGDIARIEDGVEEPRSLSRYDGKNAVALIVQKQSGTNTIEVVDRLKAKAASLESRLPPGVTVDPVRDISAFIRRSVNEVKTHLVLGGLLASIFVLLFMGSVRSTLIASIAIPASLISTFTVMKVMGFTLNNLTLLGLTLSVGIVVDDAIVVVENIFRHIDELGKKPLQAAIDGTREILLAVMATTFSLVVIFLPIAFMSGRVGRFFFSFGITVAVAILFSLVIAITLTPMLSSRFLRGGLHNGQIRSHEAGTWLNRVMHRGYGAMVRFAMAYKAVIILIAAASVAAVYPLFARVGKDFLPTDDRGEFSVYIQAPPGSSLQETSRLAAAVEGRLRAVPHVRSLLTTIGDQGTGGEDVTQANIYVRIDDLSARQMSQFQVMALARAELKKFPELRGAAQPISDIGGGSGGQNYQFSYIVQGPELDRLSEIADRVLAKMRGVSGMVDVDTAAAQRKPELRVHIQRDKAADLGVSPSAIADTLRTLVAGEAVTKYREGAEQYDVWLRLEPSARNNEASLYQIEVPSPRAGLVPLSNLATLRENTGPAQIDRINRQRQITLVANLDGLPLGTAVAKVDAFMQEEDLPAGYKTMLVGRAKTMAETGVNFAIAFGLSLIFMYMILAAQFESFLHPVTIMLSLPLCLPFALLSLLLLDETLNLYSVLGIFMLFGIVKKNGILQVDYTNTLRARGVPRDQAIYEANLTRLRPIILTTVTLIAGMIPIALGKGPGAASRASMAKVIIGGQALSLFISLLIVPVAYALFDDVSVFVRTRVPEAWRNGKIWAYTFGAGCAACGMGVLIFTSGLLAELPAWLNQSAMILVAAGTAFVLVATGLSYLDKDRAGAEPAG